MWLLLALAGCAPETKGPTDGDGDGVTEAGGDCDDADAGVFPGAGETCDGRDQDCDGLVDEAATDAPTRWTDADGDGWGTGAPVTACDAIGAARDGDCADDDGAVHPGAEEVCGDAVDSDCVDGPDNDLVCRDEGRVALGAPALAAPAVVALGRGDVDGDGAEDLLVGLPEASAVAILPGDRPLPASVDAASVRIEGPAGSALGSAVGGSLHVTGPDGPAWLFGATDCYPDDEGNDSGCFYVVEGEITASRVLGDRDDLLWGIEGDGTGTRLVAGDLDGDGVDELVVGTPGWHPAGKVRVVRGQGGWDYDVECSFAAEGADHALGDALLVAELDGDGIPEVVAGAPGAGGTGRDAGRVMVFGGGGLCGWESGTVTTVLGDTDRAATGSALAAADLDADGRAELLVGAPGESGDEAGVVWLLPGGGAITAGATVEVEALAAARWTGAAPGQRLGAALGAWDLDRDGAPDVVAAAPSAGSAGEAWVGVWYGTGALPGDAAPDLAWTAGCAEDESLGHGLLAALTRDGAPWVVLPTTCGGVTGLQLLATGP